MYTKEIRECRQVQLCIRVRNNHTEQNRTEQTSNTLNRHGKL